MMLTFTHLQYSGTFTLNINHQHSHYLLKLTEGFYYLSKDHNKHVCIDKIHTKHLKLVDDPREFLRFLENSQSD